MEHVRVNYTVITILTHERDWSFVENKGRMLIRLPILDNYYDTEQRKYYVLSRTDNKY